MGGLCGWVNFNTGTANDSGSIDRMGDQLTRYDASQRKVVTGRYSALCVSRKYGSAEVFKKRDLMAAIQGHFYWTDSELERISSSKGSAEALATGFSRRGPSILKTLRGTFSAALVDESEGVAFVANDRVGVESLGYRINDQELVFAPDFNALRAYKLESGELNPQCIFNYLYFHQVPAPGSVHRGYRRLTPGSYAILDDRGFRNDCYWHIEYREDTPEADVRFLKKEFRTVLQASINRSASDVHVGTFLSGGTDSSTVAGILCRLKEGNVTAYSIGFDADGFDELDYARIAAKHFGIRHREYYVTPDDVVEAIPKIAKIYGEPFGNSSAVPAYYCAKMAAADGVQRLLAGDGGDELFAGNERYGTQHVFSYYELVPASLRTRVLEPLAASSAMSSDLWPVRKLRRYIQQASLPMPERLERYNLLERLGWGQVLEPQFALQIDPDQPLLMLKKHYDGVRAQSLVNKMLGLDLKFTLADNDLPKVSKMCELAGIDVSYPLLDEELLEFSAELSPGLKLKGTKLRYFFKEALRDFLPPQIINKQKHGFGLPCGLWMLTHKPLAELVGDSLSDLKSRRIVRPEFMDELLERHLPEHPRYYGTMVWILMMLEHWFQVHVDSS